MSRLKSNSELETARIRQAVYIEFCKSKNIPNPCGNQPGYERIIACFIEQLMLDNNSRSATVCRYIEAINTLFCLRHLDILADLSDRANMCSRIILAREREENIARQRSPSHVRCLVPCSIWPRGCQSTQLKQSLQIGSHSSESPVCVVLNMCKNLNQHLMSTNTLHANVWSKPSSQPTGNSMTAVAPSSASIH